MCARKQMYRARFWYWLTRTESRFNHHESSRLGTGSCLFTLIQNSTSANGCFLERKMSKHEIVCCHSWTFWSIGELTLALKSSWKPSFLWLFWVSIYCILQHRKRWSQLLQWIQSSIFLVIVDSVSVADYSLNLEQDYFFFAIRTVPCANYILLWNPPHYYCPRVTCPDSVLRFNCACPRGTMATHMWRGF